MIYNPLMCLHKLDEMYRDFFNLVPIGIHVTNDCENCNGMDEKDCRFNYQDLMDKIEEEILW